MVPKRVVRIGDVVEFIFNKPLIFDDRKIAYRAIVNGGVDGRPLIMRTCFNGQLESTGTPNYINIDASLVTITRVVSTSMQPNLDWPVCPTCGEVITTKYPKCEDKKV